MRTAAQPSASRYHKNLQMSILSWLPELCQILSSDQALPSSDLSCKIVKIEISFIYVCSY